MSGTADGSTPDGSTPNGSTPDERSRLQRAAAQLSTTLLAVVRQGGSRLSSASDYARTRSEAADGDTEKAIARIINEAAAMTGATGFATSVGGVITLPLAIPADMAATAIINSRMVAAVAELRGWDIEDPVVQQLILAVVAGDRPATALGRIGIRVGAQLTERAIARVPATTLAAVNKKVGFMLLAKYGTRRGTITLAKAVPIVGGLVGGGVGAAYTKAVGAAAKRVFVPKTGDGAPSPHVSSHLDAIDTTASER